MKVFVRFVLLAGIVYGAFLLAPHAAHRGVQGARVLAQRGVSLAGAEFGVHVPGFGGFTPGTYGVDYTYCSPQTMRYFAERGLTRFRLPVRWERLQNVPGGDLNGAELGRLLETLDAAGRMGCRVVLDLHNYGRYSR